MKDESLTIILDLHERWLKREPGGVRATLSGVDLSGVDLSGEKLFRRRFIGANLSRADLSETNLSEANLFWANLSEADLSETNLSSTNLSRTNLFGANLFGADLSGANLWGTNLSEANLFGTNLSGVDLSKANLFEANLSRANLSRTVLPDFQITPSEGSFIAYKKVAGKILKLKIPHQARRTSCLTSRKCRAEYVDVLEIVGDPSNNNTLISDRGGKYQAGQRIYADKFCDDVRITCSHGIYFFMTLKEAEEW